MDSHLEGVPGLGTLTTGGLAGGDLEVLGGEADGALDAEVLGLCAVDELSADLLEGLDLAGGEGDADLVDLGGIGLAGLLGVLERHFGDGLVLSPYVSRPSQKCRQRQRGRLTWSKDGYGNQDSGVSTAK